MASAHRYLVVLPGRPGRHAPQTGIVVTATGRTGPTGRPVYTDQSGRMQMEINEHGTVRLLTPYPAPPRTPLCRTPPLTLERRPGESASPVRDTTPPGPAPARHRRIPDRCLAAESHGPVRPATGTGASAHHPTPQTPSAGPSCRTIRVSPATPQPRDRPGRPPVVCAA
ncbi:DUF6296 family protein [Kitasatospora sp. NPDC051914]|uniref:DUF6296 family protein n=1 Tax=Kitasatospora sp. NPDC051914 TaxID=3154945 RepID=UPI0034337951